MADSSNLVARYIAANEVADGDMSKLEEGFANNASHPHLPPKSGLTLGFGWDVGQHTQAELQDTWGGALTPEQIDRLKAFARTPKGKKPKVTRAALKATRDITIKYDDAVKVFEDKALPPYRDAAMARFPGLDQMNEQTQAAVIDRVYMRGANPKPGTKAAKLYMDLQNAIFKKDTFQVVAVLREMKTLHTLGGTKKRAERSADLVAETLPKIDSHSFATPGTNYQMPGGATGPTGFGLGPK